MEVKSSNNYGGGGGLRLPRPEYGRKSKSFTSISLSSCPRTKGMERSGLAFVFSRAGKRHLKTGFLKHLLIFTFPKTKKPNPGER